MVTLAGRGVFPWVRHAPVLRVGPGVPKIIRISYVRTLQYEKE